MVERDLLGYGGALELWFPNLYSVIFIFSSFFRSEQVHLKTQI